MVDGYRSRLTPGRLARILAKGQSSTDLIHTTSTKACGFQTPTRSSPDGNAIAAIGHRQDRSAPQRTRPKESNRASTKPYLSRRVSSLVRIPGKDRLELNRGGRREKGHEDKTGGLSTSPFLTTDDDQKPLEGRSTDCRPSREKERHGHPPTRVTFAHHPRPQLSRPPSKGDRTNS